MKHRKLAESCWRMIKALASGEGFHEIGQFTLDDLDAAAINLIEMACDSAAESQRIADGHPPKGAV